MKTNILLELPYLPPVSWMALAWQSKTLWLEACENYQKGSYRNRCHIAGPNGIQRLSVPLEKGKHQQTPIRQVRMAFLQPWKLAHWRSIQTAYGNAPYFEFYGHELESFYLSGYVELFRLNLALLQWLLKKTGWKGSIRFTQRFASGESLGISDFRNAVSPRDASLPQWFQPAIYPQVFAERHGFLPNLSSLDLLFCCGKHSGDILSASLSDHFNSTNTRPGPPS